MFHHHTGTIRRLWCHFVQPRKAELIPTWKPYFHATDLVPIEGLYCDLPSGYAWHFLLWFVKLTTKGTSVPTLSTTISAHLIAATEIINAAARSTVRATPSARDRLSHIDAAHSFMVAADALYEAAEWVARGEPKDAQALILALRMADAKAAEGRSALAVAGHHLSFCATRCSVR